MVRYWVKLIFSLSSGLHFSIYRYSADGAYIAPHVHKWSRTRNSQYVPDTRSSYSSSDTRNSNLSENETIETDLAVV